MHVITRSCVLLVWMQTLTFVKSQEHLQACTLHDFLNGPLFDSNFNTTGLETRYVAGKQIRVSCSIGYSGFFKLICIEGKWDKRGTKCQPRSCGHPGDAPFADFQLAVGDDFVFGSQVLYTCHKGYQTVSRISHRRCLSEGWDGEVPTCEAITCKLELPSLHGTEYDPSSKRMFSPGDTVTVTCGQSHWISDQLQRSAVVSCKEDGQWSLRPDCQEVTCSNRRDPLVSWWDVYQGQQKKLGDEVRYGCKSGYKRTGGDTRATCTREGWKPDPLCQAPLDCQQPPPLENGDTKNSVKFSYSQNERVEYACQAYYVIEGGPFKTCNDGEWTGEIRCLKPCTVDEEALRTHNIMFRYSRKDKMYLAHDDSIEFWCTRGRTVGSVGMRQKCVDGVLHLPSCR